MPVRRVALVGHCGFDSGSLSRLAGEIAPGAEVVRVNDQSALEQVAGADSLLLVNRVLDGRFDVGDSGIQLIASLSKRDSAPPMMLVSNYADAQQQAQAAGALPGFGKSEVGSAALRQRLTKVVEEH